MKQKQNPAASSLFNTAAIDSPAFSGRKFSVQFDEPDLTSDAGLAALSASGVGKILLSGIAAAPISLTASSNSPFSTLTSVITA